MILPATLHLTAHCDCSFLFHYSLQNIKLICCKKKKKKVQNDCSEDAFLTNDHSQH